jgi:hypothetical protein
MSKLGIEKGSSATHKQEQPDTLASPIQTAETGR